MLQFSKVKISSQYLFQQLLSLIIDKNEQMLMAML
jgi:hypothetical protein